LGKVSSTEPWISIMSSFGTNRYPFSLSIIV
jgi:hypothetical protein